MGAAAFVIPLAGLVLPIVLIFIALLIDAIAVVWYAYRLWHDEYGVRLGQFITNRMTRPVGRYVGARRAALLHLPR
jgi:hypothetical protein